MKITILCTDSGHPVVDHLLQWRETMTSAGHLVDLIHDKSKLTQGDLLFLVSCSQVIRASERSAYGAALVLHASDLPRGRGWSPHIWAIVRGASQITVCLLEATDPVDSGAIWLRRTFDLVGHELLDEINDKLFATELELMTEAVNNINGIRPLGQVGDPGEYMTKRTPQHSRLDPNKSLGEQFDLLRVVDSARYPAFMDFRGCRYVIRIEKDKCDGQ
jgi:methionyl-tRNA formyltransferase